MIRPGRRLAHDQSGEATAQSRSHFFNRLWIGAAAGVLLVGLLVGRPALTLLALLFLFAAAIGAVWNRVALSAVDYDRQLSEHRCFPGDTTELRITVTNRKPVPVAWLSIEEELSGSLVPIDRPTTISGTSGRRVMQLQTRLGPFEAVTWRISLECVRRGAMTIGPTTLRASDPLGFFTSRRRRDDETGMLVYPRLQSLGRVDFPMTQPVGAARAFRLAPPDPIRIVGIRDYRPDDPFRSIHWKATAREGSLRVRVVESASATQLGIFANLDTFDHYWEGLDVDAAEGVIELAAAIAAWADGRGDPIGLFANGVLAGTDHPLQVRPGRDPDHLPRLLAGLARLSPYSTLPFHQLLERNVRDLAWGSTLVVITPMMPPPVAEQLAFLASRGYRVVLVPVAGCPVPAIRGLIVSTEDALFGGPTDGRTDGAA